MLLLLFFFKMFVGPLSKDKFLPCGDRQQLLLLNLILLQDIYFFNTLYKPLATFSCTLATELHAMGHFVLV